MIQIPLNSSVDLETENIIQTQEIAFKRKNSLVHKGILSNITSKSGAGILSTTGKQISVTGNTIKIDGENAFTLHPEAYITESGSEQKADDILFARKVDDDLIIMHKISTNSITVERAGKTQEFLADASSIDINGTIDIDGQVIFVQYFNASTQIRIYEWDDTNKEYVLSVNRSVLKVLGSTSVTTYKSGLSLYIGFDSEDMRKRFVYRIAGGTLYEQVEGMGLVSETGLVTGEPFFYTYIKDADSQHQLVNSDEITTRYFSSISYKDNINYFDYNVLSNGVIVSKRFDDTLSNYHYTRITGISAGEPTVTDYTMAKSWKDAVKDLKQNPTDYHSGSQTGAGDFPTMTGIMDISPGYFTSNGTDTSKIASHYYVAAIQLSADGESWLEPFFLPAMRRSPYGSDETANPNVTQFQSWSRGTEISFFNFSSPIGNVGTDVLESEQMFPHMRFFSNSFNEKGKFWDYGKGWVRFYYDRIHYVNYNDFGSAIYEEPLRIITITKDGMNSDIVDTLSYNTMNTNDYREWTPTTGSYYDTSDGAIADEKEFLLLQGTLNKNYIKYSNGIDIYGTISRIHPVKDSQVASTSWYYNHSFGSPTDSLLNSIPFSVSLSDNISGQIYSGIKTSLAYNKTLLFTPHTMGDDYTFNGDYITTWSKGNISWAKIESTGDVKVSKMTDYIFKTNIIGNGNVLTESRNGSFKLERAFIPYIMDSYFNPFSGTKYIMPEDASYYNTNDVYYFGAGFNPLLLDKAVASSFILPAATIPSYVDTSVLQNYNIFVLNEKKGLIRADIQRYFYDNENVDEYWTHANATTDVSYKNTRYLVNGSVNDTIDEDLLETSWIGDSETILYPIGILSKIYGENYITSTVDVGDNYVSRFYNKANKTYLVYNNTSAVYFGSEIFTIQSGNYYFDGQGIYYLGSQTDYSQNVFTAYAIGMKFLANSSSEAYFYSAWDKNLYLYTASNTLQKSISLADMGNIVDSLYSSAEQALYILFDDGKLFIKTQNDSCLIEGVIGDTLQSTAIGCQIISEDGFEIYNPWMHSTLEPLHIETEWLGNPDAVTNYQYIDFVIFSETNENVSFGIAVDSLNGGKIAHEEKTVTVTQKDWENNLFRVRLVPKQILGNAIKMYLDSEEPIHLFSLSVSAIRSSDQTSAARNARY